MHTHGVIMGFFTVLIMVCGLFFGAFASSAAAHRLIVTTLTDTADPPFDADGLCGTGTVSDLPGTDGLISLREAIIAANNTNGEQTVTFAPSLSGGAIVVGFNGLPLPALCGGHTRITGDLDGTAYQVTERSPVEAKASKQLGRVRNEVASTLLPGTRYDNIVNIGCGWASGVNFSSSYDWPSLLPSIMSDPANVYDILTSPQNFTRYQNRYAILVKEALEARDGTSINLIDVAKTGHTSPYGRFEIDDLDAIIAEQFGGELSGNTLVLYEFGPPDFIRLVSMLFDRDPELNPIATSFGGEPLPPGASAFGDSYWQARFIGSQGGDPSIPDKVLQRYAGHFLPTQSRKAVPYVDETDVLGPPYSNELTVSDRFFASYARDYQRLLGNDNGKYGNKVDIIAIGNENPYEGGANFRQYGNSVSANTAAIFPCTLFPTFFGCRPDTIGSAQLGIDDEFAHPFARKLEELAFDYTNKMLEQARAKGVSMINVYTLFAGHHSRFDDPTSPYYVEADPTYWAYMAEINALGHEVVADVMLHILNTGKSVYARKHSDTFRQRALENEFPGVFGY